MTFIWHLYARVTYAPPLGFMGPFNPGVWGGPKVAGINPSKSLPPNHLNQTGPRIVGGTIVVKTIILSTIVVAYL